MDLTPILVGVGQVTEKGVDPAQAMGPVEMMVEAAGRAANDAGLGRKRLADIDLLVAIKSVVEVLEVDDIRNMIENPPEALAGRIGAARAKKFLSATGGNTPQMLVNQIAQRISEGRAGTALLAGAEALETLSKAIQSGLDRNWHIPSRSNPRLWSPEREGASGLEIRHDLYLPANVYPLFENALRHHCGRSVKAHQQYLGRLFSRFTEVAEKNPFAWFRTRRSAEEIAVPSDGNRFIAFPYTKRMNAMIKVNQAAALIMTSVENARRMGIDPSQWIYLNGCAEATDIWHVSQRINYHTSPAIALAGQKALAMAGCSIDDIAFFDLYSCFPSAVQIARDMLGVKEDDPRPLTVTGGLPYHGGPGNNYSMHAIAAMVQKLRKHPDKTGLVTANGWYITKHAVGIYSARPNTGPWQRENPETYQKELDALARPEVAENPSGRGRIETYTVVYNRDGTPGAGIVIGRQTDRKRFVAVTPPDRQLLEDFTTRDPIDTWGMLRQQDQLNVFSPE